MAHQGIRIAQLACIALLLSACGDDAAIDGSPSGDTGADEVDSGMGHVGDGDMVPEAIPCDDDIEVVTIGMQTTGRAGLYMAEVADLSPAPPQKFRNDWKVRLLDASGEPVPSANITKAEPYMVPHDHNGLFEPEISAGEEDGEFAVDNLNMWMGGPWEVRLWVDGDAGEDYLVFDVCIED